MTIERRSRGEQGDVERALRRSSQSLTNTLGFDGQTYQGSPSNWQDGRVPTTIQEALERIAFVLADGGTPA